MPRVCAAVVHSGAALGSRSIIGPIEGGGGRPTGNNGVAADGPAYMSLTLAWMPISSRSFLSASTFVASPTNCNVACR